MAPDRFSYLRGNRCVALRGRCHVFPQRFPPAWLGRRRVCHLHAGLGRERSHCRIHQILFNEFPRAAGQFFCRHITFYLVATAWWSARRRDGETGIFDWAGLLVAFSVGAALVISGMEAAYGNTALKHDFPVAPYFVFGSVALLSAAGDVRMLGRGGVSGSKRIVRHLWRMSIAFFIAAA